MATDTACRDSPLAEACRNDCRGPENRRGDRGGRSAGAAPAGARLDAAPAASGGLSDLQIIDRQGQVLLASSNLAEPPRLIDISTIESILDGAAEGIRQVSAEHFRAVVASSARRAGRARHVITLGSDAGRPLRALPRHRRRELSGQHARPADRGHQARALAGAVAGAAAAR